MTKFIKLGHLEKVQKIDEGCLGSTGKITVKKDKSVEIALDSRKLNISGTKMRPNTPNMEDLSNQLSTKKHGQRTNHYAYRK